MSHSRPREGTLFCIEMTPTEAARLFLDHSLELDRLLCFLPSAASFTAYTVICSPRSSSGAKQSIISSFCCMYLLSQSLLTQSKTRNEWSTCLTSSMWFYCSAGRNFHCRAELDLLAQQYEWWKVTAEVNLGTEREKWTTAPTAELNNLSSNNKYTVPTFSSSGCI